jgi:hypothetical protein|tara:strand:+ start:587 stop:814 length:228 start_codon:yes stop_codon:yes gene_type:complete
MQEIRGKTLKEWKDYCKNDNVPINTMKYITCLEERIEALTIPVVVKSFYCDTKMCKQDGIGQCIECALFELNKEQ